MAGYLAQKKKYRASKRLSTFARYNPLGRLMRARFGNQARRPVAFGRSRRLGLRRAFKVVRSRNITRTRKGKTQGPTDFTSDIGFMKLSIWLHRKQKLFKALGTWNYDHQLAGSMMNVEGQQAVANMVGHITIPQLAAGFLAPNLIQWTDSAFSMNPFQKVTGGNVITAGTIPSEDVIHFKKIFSEAQVTNFSNIGTTITIFWYLALQTQQESPIDVWTRSLSDRKLGQLNATQNTVTLPAIVGAPVKEFYGQTPEMLSNFRKLWKCLKKTTFPLAAGSTKKIIYEINVNKSINETVVNEVNNNGNNFLKGYTIVPVIISRPEPVVLAQADGTDIGVTIGTCKVGWTLHSHYAMTALTQRVSYDRIWPNLAHDTIAGANEKFMDIVDAVAAVANA